MRGVPRSPYGTRGAGRLLGAACVCLATSVAPPALAGEAPPRLVSAIVQKSPTRSRLTIAFTPVASATGYNLQASKALTFTRLVVDAKSEASPFTDVVVAPGVYFVRLRGLGAAGPGPFGPVEVVNALASGLQILERGGGAHEAGVPGTPRGNDSAATASSAAADLAAASPVASAGGATPAMSASPSSSPGNAASTASAPSSSSPGPVAASHARTPATPPAGTPPPLAPAAGYVTTAGSEPSTSGALAANTAAASVRPDVEPQPGPTGAAADAASAIPPPVSEQDLAALGPLRVRYEALRADLQQIEALRQALAASATIVLRQLAGTRDARESAELVNELSALQAARREIDAEIERNLLELGRILARAPAGP